MTMFECDACARPALFLDGNDECPECAKGNPQERAAIALFDDFKHSIGWPSKTWDDPALDDTTGRETFRRKARLALTAAINVDELAEHIGPDHARIVHTHLLGGTMSDPVDPAEIEQIVDLDTIRAAAAAATPGPWEYFRDSNYQAADCPPAYEPLVTANGGYDAIIDWSNGGTDADAVFIAHARTDIPALLDHVDELQHRIDQVLDLHHERNHRPLDGTHLGGTICDHCRRPWPCPTVQTLTS